MRLLALAGGHPGPNDGEVLGCCFVFLFLPMVVFLAGSAAYHKAFWPAILALVLAGLPYLLLQAMVAGYQPSDDWEVTNNQAADRRLAGWYLGLVGLAAASLLYVGWRRLLPLRGHAKPGGAADGGST